MSHVQLTLVVAGMYNSNPNILQDLTFLIVNSHVLHFFSISTEDEALGEADSFVGQTPPSSHSTAPQPSLSTSALFQGTAGTTNDPFGKINQGALPRAPPVGSGPRVTSLNGTSSSSPIGPPLAAVPPMPSASGKYFPEL